MARRKRATKARRVRVKPRRKPASSRARRDPSGKRPAPRRKAVRRQTMAQRASVEPVAAAAPRGEDMALAARDAELEMDRRRERDDVHERDLSGS